MERRPSRLEVTLPILVVQMSDLHIRSSNDPVLLRVEAVVSAIRGQRVEPSACFVVVPGDVAFSGKAEEYKLAEGFFRELLTRIEQTYPGVRPDIVFVPGNHDCDMHLAADVRQLDLARPVLPNIDVDGALVEHYLEVQVHFFTFAGEFGQTQRSSRERLLTRKEFISARSSRIAFSLYNTAWLSQNPEKPANLFFPTAVIPPIAETNADVEIAVFHHPYNWLEPRNSLEFQHAVESRSDLVLTGHEHVPDAYAKVRPSGAVQFLPGQAMFDSREPRNGFNLIAIDLESKAWKTTRFDWSAPAFIPSSDDDVWTPFLRNRALVEAGFHNNPAFTQELGDPGTGFTHIKKDLRLHDIFVYPSLLHRLMQQKMEGKTATPKRIAGDDVPDFVVAQRKVLILGADRAGKTSLARTLYQHLQRSARLVPLLLEGSQICDVRRLDEVVDAAFARQYSRGALERFRQLAPNRRAVIIDNFDEAKARRRSLGSCVEKLQKDFETVVVFVDEFFEIEHITSAADMPILMGFRQYGIEELNRVQRSRLISRWTSLGRAEGDDETIEREIEVRERTVDTLLGKRLLPAHPVIILAILQALETARNLNTASGSYGELYEALITDRIASVSKKPTDIGTKYTLLSRLAYSVFGKDTDSLSEDDIAGICDDYFREYGIRLEPTRLASDLLAAGILRVLGGSYSFKYPYYYQFFVAKYYMDNLNNAAQALKLRAELEQMADRVYYEPYAYILVFYLYLTKDPLIIDRILQNAQRIYRVCEPATLEGDVAFLNRLYVSPAKPIELPETDVAANREDRRKQMDEIDEATSALAYRGERVAYSDDLSDYIKINIALKTVYILGQVLRNFPGSLRRETKTRIAEECYMLGLRVLRFALASIEGNTDELRRYYAEMMREHQPALAPAEIGQSAEEAIITVSELWSFGIIKMLSFAVGMEELAETYKEVLAKHQQKLSVQMVDASVKMDHFWSFPSSQVDSLLKRVQKNAFAYTVLRDLVAHHLYLYRADHAVRQKYTQVFKIASGKAVLMLGGGLAKSADE